MKEEIEIDEMAAWLVVIFITLFGGWLRVLLIANKGMWLDETFSVWIANHSVTDMLQWIARIDQHPPLYYLLLHYWIMRYGASPYDVRLLSALFGAGTIPMIFLIGKRISGSVMGLVAAMFLALSLFNIYFAQETRMYTLLSFNAAVAIYALVRLLTDSRSTKPIGSQLLEYMHGKPAGVPSEPKTQHDFSYKDENLDQTGWRGWLFRYRWIPVQAIETDLSWAIFIVFSAATLLTHNTAVFFFIAINIFVLGLMLVQRKKQSESLHAFQAPSLGNWIKAQFGIFLLWSPWLLIFIKQASRVNQEFWIPKPTWETVTKTLRSLLNPSAPSQTSQVMIWIMCALLCLGLVYYRKKLSIFLFLTTLFAVPVLGELLVSMRRPIFLDKTLIWITIPLFLAFAAGISQLRVRLLMIAVLGILATNYLFSISDYYKFFQKEDWSSAAGYVANYTEKDDLILFNSNFVEIPFDYYFKPFEQQYSLQVIRHGVPLDLFDSGVSEPIMTMKDIPGLISLIKGHNRVWLVYSHDSYTDPRGIIPQTLASKMKLVRTREFYGGKVQLYETP
ncbi:MAG: glycosyltransferase family 39 protein [Anaerolineales bacterium]